MLSVFGLEHLFTQNRFPLLRSRLSALEHLFTQNRYPLPASEALGRPGPVRTGRGAGEYLLDAEAHLAIALTGTLFESSPVGHDDAAAALCNQAAGLQCAQDGADRGALDPEHLGQPFVG